MREKYVIRDFHPLVFFYFLGFLMTTFGLVLGIVEVVLRLMGNAITTPTIVLVALLLISGSQFMLFAMWFDMESNKDLGGRGRRRTDRGSDAALRPRCCLRRRRAATAAAALRLRSFVSFLLATYLASGRVVRRYHVGPCSPAAQLCADRCSLSKRILKAPVDDPGGDRRRSAGLFVRALGGRRRACTDDRAHCGVRFARGVHLLRRRPYCSRHGFGQRCPASLGRHTRLQRRAQATPSSLSTETKSSRFCSGDDQRFGLRGNASARGTSRSPRSRTPCATIVAVFSYENADVIGLGQLEKDR